MQPISDVLPDVLKLWKNVLPSMLLGCFLGNLFRNTVLLQRLGRVMHPLARLGHLPAGCATTLTLSLADRIAGHTMLAELKNNGVVKTREVVITFLVSAIPTGLYSTIFSFGPAVVASLGYRTGGMCLAVYLSTNLMVGTAGLLLGRLILPRPGQVREGSTQTKEAVHTLWRDKLVTAARRAIPAFCRLAAVFMPVTFLASILLHTELVKHVLRQVEPILSHMGLPGPMLFVITTGVMNMIAAVGTLGPILQAGLVTPAEAVTGLLVTSIVHQLYEFWIYSLPTNVSIFGPKLGMEVSLAALLVREFATFLAVGTVVLLV